MFLVRLADVAGVDLDAAVRRINGNYRDEISRWS